MKGFPSSRAAPAWDVWSLGVVLLDLLCGGAGAFDDFKSGLETQALFDGEEQVPRHGAVFWGL